MKDLAEDPQLACEGAFRGEDYALADDLFGEENRVGKGEFIYEFINGYVLIMEESHIIIFTTPHNEGIAYTTTLLL